ncbi:xanthine dehydrogenase accessory protein XdhC [Pigmentiphaga sp.]|jgi:xanthine dehydrogenase accessory protein XdhC|uniref:xanthine dehydrogenase accessory protein XdhC n=1 Tax=Pigmentiphaga sp. TaxID=1977564 RepID=UPI0025E06693|nr:xanthine dehydrogenase accessory protein XdhC [Pigmentiphaga sp.]MBX6318131.1 xanthine dehydrogenase accessory protein XdhC [Pigmentiphaga sp.]
MTGAPLLPEGLADFARTAPGPLCLVRILGVRGSVPRGTDAAMLVAGQGVAGTIGGGHLEYEAIRHARALLARSTEEGVAPADEIRRFALGPSLGQCCGGSVELGFSVVFDPAAAVPMLSAMEARPHELWLYGAGHVARALVHVMLPLPFRIRWIDTRDDVFPEPLPSHVRPVSTDDAASEAATAPAGALHLVMTHSHALDFDIVRTVLERGNAAYCGLIGSATKRATFERRLRARGMDEASIARLTCPVGLPHLSGKLPGVIAVSVAAQLLAVVQALKDAQK